MYRINYIQDLDFNYDGEFFDEIEEITITNIYFRINELGLFPFVEIYLNSSGNLESFSKNCIHYNNFQNYIENFKTLKEEDYKSIRFQGYKKQDNKLYFFYKVYYENISKNSYYNNINGLWCSYDDINKKKYFDIEINEKIILLFKSFKRIFIIENVKSNEIYKVPLTIYSYLCKNEKNMNFIEQNLTLFLLNDDYNFKFKKYQNDYIKIKNIVFNKNIINYKCLISYFF